MCWGRLVIPAFGRLGQEAHDYKASLDYIARSCVKMKQQKLFRMEGGGRQGHGPSLLLAAGSPAALCPREAAVAAAGAAFWLASADSSYK